MKDECVIICLCYGNKKLFDLMEEKIKIALEFIIVNVMFQGQGVQNARQITTAIRQNLAVLANHATVPEICHQKVVVTRSPEPVKSVCTTPRVINATG